MLQTQVHYIEDTIVIVAFCSGFTHNTINYKNAAAILLHHAKCLNITYNQQSTNEQVINECLMITDDRKQITSHHQQVVTELLQGW
jgi:hypothetical protein